MTKEQDLKKNMLWNAAGNLIYLGSQWLITVLVANIGNFKDAGILSIAMSISATFQTLAMFGLRNFQISDVENKYSDSAYVKFRVVTCTVALLGCMLFSLLGGYGVGYLLPIFIFMLFRLSENFSDVLHGIAQKNGRLDIAGKSFAIKGLSTLVIFIAGYKLSDNLSVSLLLMAALSWTSTLLYDMVVVRKLSQFRLWTPRLDWFSLAKETAPLCIYLFLSAAIYTVPKLILEQRCGEEILGAYSSIFAPALLISTAAGYLYTPFVPAFAEARQENDSRAFIMLFLKISVAVAAFALITVIAAVFLGDFALGLLFGDKILGYTYLLIPILVSIFVNAMFTFLCTLCVVLRDFRGLLVACAAGLVCEVAVTGTWIDSSGVNATSYGYILACAISGIMLLFRMLYLLFGKNKKGV